MDNLGGNIELNKKFKKGQIGIGLEAGVQKANKPSMVFNENVTVTTNIRVNETDFTEVDNRPIQNTVAGSKTKAYFTPTLRARVNMGKNDKLSLNLDASAYQGQVGLRYTF